MIQIYYRDKIYAKLVTYAIAKQNVDIKMYAQKQWCYCCIVAE